MEDIRINSNKVEMVLAENIVGYNFVFREKCNGCRSLNYRFYQEPKLLIKAHYCELFKYSRFILEFCPCVDCLVKLMCNKKDGCYRLKEFVEEVINEKYS